MLFWIICPFCLLLAILTINYFPEYNLFCNQVIWFEIEKYMINALSSKLCDKVHWTSILIYLCILSKDGYFIKCLLLFHRNSLNSSLQGHASTITKCLGVFGSWFIIKHSTQRMQRYVEHSFPLLVIETNQEDISNEKEFVEYTTCLILTAQLFL